MLIYEKLVDGIFLVYSNSQFWFKCQGILIKNKNLGDILIDCNCYYKKELRNLLENQIEAYFVSHVHLDHVYNLHLYEEFNPKIKIYCPIPEDEYLRDFNTFLRDNGTLDFGIGDNFKKGIVEPAELINHIIKSGSELTNLILRVDRIISAKGSGPAGL